MFTVMYNWINIKILQVSVKTCSYALLDAANGLPGRQKHP